MVRRGMSAECPLSAALSGPFVRGALLVRLTRSNVPGDSSTTVDLLACGLLFRCAVGNDRSWLRRKG